MAGKGLRPGFAFLIGLLGMGALALLAGPLSNPDLFWCLSLGRQGLREGSLAGVERLSWTLPGTAWVNYYWLVELFYYTAYRFFGIGGLWAWKTLLLGASAALAALTVRSTRAGRPAQAAALLGAALALVPAADLRPENFSLLLFAGVLYGLERLRAGRWTRRPGPVFGWALAGGALWGNLHPGFLLGAALAAVEAADALLTSRRSPDAEERQDARRRLRACLALAAGLLLGPLLNPWGPKLYGVVFYHGAGLAKLERFLSQWGPPLLARPADRPFFFVLAASAALVVLRLKLGLQGGLRLAALAALAVLALRRERFAAYFGLAAVVWTLGSLPEPETRPGRFRAWFFALFLPGLMAAFALRQSFHAGVRVWRPGDYPGGAAAFLKSRPELWPLKAYNPWYWGGYLGLVLPELKVYSDGRHIFHPLVAEVAEAGESPIKTRALMDLKGVELAVLDNVPSMAFQRPAYVTAFPEEDWSLVYWDPVALILVRRGKADPVWLARREYRAYRPRDEAHTQQAFSAGKLKRATYFLELARWNEDRRRPALLP